MIAVPAAMLSEESGNRVRAKQAAGSASRLSQQSLDLLQLRASQPISPGRGESHLLTIDDVMRQKIFHSFFQNEFAGHSLNLVGRGNACGEFHEWMVEERHSTLYRGGHAHLILLHQ